MFFIQGLEKKFVVENAQRIVGPAKPFLSKFFLRKNEAERVSAESLVFALQKCAL